MRRAVPTKAELYAMITAKIAEIRAQLEAAAQAPLTTEEQQALARLRADLDALERQSRAAFAAADGTTDS